VKWQTLRHALEYLVVRVAICVIQACSLDFCQRASKDLAYFCCEVLRLRRRITQENLRAAYPEWTEDECRKLALRMWEHLFLMVVEIAHLPLKLHETNWRRYVSNRHKEWIVSAMLQDRPTIVISAHFGNFELAGYMLGLYGFPTFTVARTLDNPFLDDYVNRFRSKTGQRIIPKDDCYEKILEVLAKNGAITFLADQHAGAKGLQVKFFGRSASAYKAIALFSLQHDAPMVIGTARRIGKPLEYELAIHAVADPRRPELGDPRKATQWYTTITEEFIREAPEQYWWLHDRWKQLKSSSAKKPAAMSTDSTPSSDRQAA